MTRRPLTNTRRTTIQRRLDAIKHQIALVENADNFAASTGKLRPLYREADRLRRDFAEV